MSGGARIKHYKVLVAIVAFITFAMLIGVYLYGIGVFERKIDVVTVPTNNVKAENIGYWPASPFDVGEDAYATNLIWGISWTKSLTRVFTKDIYVQSFGNNLKLGTAVVTVYPVYYSSTMAYFYINVFVIYNAGNYYSDTLPAQRTLGEAWWIHHLNLGIVLDKNESNGAVKGYFGDDACAVITGYWVYNGSSKKDNSYEFILSENFSENASAEWKQKLEKMTDSEGLRGIIDGAKNVAGAFSLAKDIMSNIAFPSIGIPLREESRENLTLYDYYVNTNNFKSLSSNRFPPIDTIHHRYTTELSYDFTPAGNPNIKYYWDHYNWPVAVNAWASVGLDVDGYSSEKFTFDFSTELTSMQPNHQNQNVNVGFSYPIVLKNKSGYDVENRYGQKEIYPLPTYMGIIYSAENVSNHVYKGEPYKLRIIVPNNDVVCSPIYKPRLRVNFSDGSILDIPTNEDIYSQDSSQTVFEITHTWNLKGIYAVTAFLYCNHPEEKSEYYGNTSWSITSCEGVWVSGIMPQTIVAIDSTGGGG